MPESQHFQYLKSTWTEADAWPEFVEVMRRSVIPDYPSEGSASTPAIDWLKLPILCCEAAGGNPLYAQPIALAWGLLYTAAHLMDSAADHDEVPAWMLEAGPGSMINIATGLYASSALALGKMLHDGIEPEIVVSIQNRFNRIILQMCSGQHLDLNGTFQDLDTCWRVVRAKSGAMFELACAAGAMIGTKDVEAITLYGEFGMHLGVMVQICDDASEIWCKRDGDRMNINCYSIPIAYTMSVLADEDLTQMLALLERADEDPEASEMVCRKVNLTGTGLYLQTMFQYHRQHSLDALCANGPRDPLHEKLVGYVNQLSLQV